MILATIDLGSNSFHLLIVKVTSIRSFEVLMREKHQVQLRSGLTKDGSLDESSQQRALMCFESFSKLLHQYQPKKVRVIGTYTLRSAKHIQAFLKRAQEVLGYPIEIISGLEEARLIYVGVTSEIQSGEPCLVVDIGGGSTELVIGQSAHIIQSVSLEMGCVSFQNQFFPKNFSGHHFDHAIDAAKDRLATIADKYIVQGWSTCLGSSGTVQAVSSIMNMKYGDERITAERLRALKQDCIQVGTLDNLHINGLREDRENILPGGLSILIAAFSMLGIEEMQVSKAAIREGVMNELIQQCFSTTLAKRSVNHRH